MKSRFLPLVISFGLTLLPDSRVEAAMVTLYSNDVIGSILPPQQALVLSTSGNYGGGGSQALGTTADFTVTINDATLTLTYNAIAVEVPSFTTSNTVLFTTGLGQTTSVTTNITYNAFSILYAATEALALTATTGGNFSIALPSLQAFGAVALSGQYSVVGPTQTATGNFSTASFAAAGAPGMFRWATFNSLGYPNSSQLTNPNASTIGLRNRWNLTGSIFDVTVDGAQVTANVGTLVINPGGFGNVPLAVPEPASTALLGFGALLLSRRRREPLGFA